MWLGSSVWFSIAANGICDMVLVYGFLLQPLCCHATQHRCVVFVAVGFSICVVTLAPSHPVLSDGKLVTNVNFQLCGGNRLVNKISGKHKRVSVQIVFVVVVNTDSCLFFLVFNITLSYLMH